MFERFTDRARLVLQLAQEEARLLDHGFMGTEHVLLALVHERGGVAAKVLESVDISLEAAREMVEEIGGTPAGGAIGSPPFTPRTKKVLELSLREALELGHSYIGTEHLLLGLVREGEGVATQVLVGLGADPAGVRQRTIEAMSGFTPVEKGGTRPARGMGPRRPKRRGPGGARDTVVVVGEGSAAAVFDIAVLEVGLEARAETASDALGQVTARTEAILAALSEQGLADTAIATTGVSLRTRIDEHDHHVAGHVASLSLTVRLDDTARAPALVDALSRARADALRLDGLHTAASSLEEAPAEAGARAVDDAPQRAERPADAAGVRLGRVLAIADAGVTGHGPRGGTVLPPWSAPAELPGEAGSGELTARVTVTFEFGESHRWQRSARGRRWAAGAPHGHPTIVTPRPSVRRRRRRPAR